MSKNVMSMETLSVVPRITFRATETDSETVIEYANLMRQGVEFPPVTLAEWGKGNVALVDGVHRLTAAMNAKLDKLPVTVVKVKSKLEAELLAFRANVTHGKLLTADEKRKACIELLKQPVMAKLSNVKAAQRMGVSDMTVKRYRDGIGTKSPAANHNGHKGKSATEPKIDKGGKVEPQGKPSAAAWSLTGGSWSGGGVDVIVSGLVGRITEGVGPKSTVCYNKRLDYIAEVAKGLLAFADANRVKAE